MAKRAVVYGAGKLVRCFISQILHASGYEIVFLELGKDLVRMLNEAKRYPVRLVTNDETKEFYIDNFRAEDSSQPGIAAKEMLEADLMVTSVGARNLQYIAQPIAEGLKARIDAGKAPLNIILAENLNDSGHYMREQVCKYLDEVTIEKLDANVGFIEASIGRMVPELAKGEADDPLLVRGEPYEILQIDGAAVVGKKPELVNTLFCDPIEPYIQRKLFVHNMCHCACAYLAAGKYEFIHEAMCDPAIRYLVEQAGLVGVRSIAAEGKMSYDSLLDFLIKLQYRFSNVNLRDTIARVGADPVRKLGNDDRITGLYRLAKKHGVDVSFLMPVYAAALCYRNEADKASVQVNDDYKTSCVKETLKKYTGIDFSDEEIRQIEAHITNLQKGDFAELIRLAESARAKNTETT